MMLSYKNLRIRSQLLVLIAFMLVISVSIQAFVYTQFSQILKKQAVENNKILFEQIINQIEEMNSETNKITGALLGNTNVQGYLTTNDMQKKQSYAQAILNNINYIKEYTVNIIGISILDNDGGVVSTDGSNYEAIYRIISDYSLSNKLVKKPFYTKYYLNDKNTGEFIYAYVHQIIGIETDYSIGKNIGTEIILCSIEQLQKKFNKINLPQSSILRLIDTKKSILASTEKKEIGTKFIDKSIKDALAEKTNFQGEFYNHGVRYLAHKLFIKEMDLYVINIVPISVILEEVNFIAFVCLIIFFIASIIIIFGGTLFVNGICKPIAKIVKDLDNINSLQSGERISVPAKNEVGIIAQDVNNMLDRIEKLSLDMLKADDELYKAKLWQKQSELIYLQRQINPHFLYNSLECIRSMGIYHGTKDIVSITTSMSKLFRYSLNTNNTVKVREEIQIINEFFNVMMIRFNNIFSISIDCCEEILEVSIIKMVLQPIAENCFKYAFDGNSTDGHISLSGRFLEKNVIIIEISDNGYGIEGEKLDKINKMLSSNNDLPDEDNNSTHIGLKNVNTRLKLMYGLQYGVMVDSSLGEGTKVSVKIPVSI